MCVCMNKYNFSSTYDVLEHVDKIVTNKTANTTVVHLIDLFKYQFICVSMNIYMCVYLCRALERVDLLVKNGTIQYSRCAVVHFTSKTYLHACAYRYTYVNTCRYIYTHKHTHTVGTRTKIYVYVHMYVSVYMYI